MGDRETFAGLLWPSDGFLLALSKCGGGIMYELRVGEALRRLLLGSEGPSVILAHFDSFREAGNSNEAGTVN